MSDATARAIQEMLASDLNPHRFVEKGFMDAVVEWPEARDAMIERFSGLY